MKATQITSYTLVGFYGAFPRQRGNCFSVYTDSKESFRIVNFGLENLEKLIEEKIIEFPIEIEVLEKDFAIINDERIHDDWYQKDYCSVCCPQNLWPLHQKQAYDRKIRRGEIVEKTTEDGKYNLILCNPDKTLKRLRFDENGNKIEEPKFENIVFGKMNIIQEPPIIVK